MTHQTVYVPDSINNAMSATLSSQTARPTGHEFQIPSLDGLRAVAIALVIVSHAGLGELVPGGFGVTVFFFLSGYLICTLLRREWESHDHISLRNFYLRRVLRIFPPMYLVLALGIALTLMGVFSDQLTWFAIIAQALHVTNYYYIYSGVGMVPGLGVYWSLAIEEHFYLVFPMLLPILLRTHSPKRQAILLSCICLLILVWRIILVYVLHADHLRTYFSTDTRLDAILWGCVLALFCNPMLDRRLNVATTAKGVYAVLFGAIGLLVVSLLIRDDQYRETFRYTLQSMALFPVFYLAVAEYKRFPFTLLNLAFVRYIGKVSYPLYLVHYLILLLVERHFSDHSHLSMIILWLVMTLGLSMIIHHLVERPMTRFRRKLET